MRDIRILPASDVEQFTAGLFDMFNKSVLAQRRAAQEGRQQCEATFVRGTWDQNGERCGNEAESGDYLCASCRKEAGE
jgi:hypothetical protein